LLQQRKFEKWTDNYNQSKKAINNVKFLLDKENEISADGQFWLFDRLDIELENIKEYNPNGQIKLQIKMADLKDEL
jgi:hypothetical protein